MQSATLEPPSATKYACARPKLFGITQSAFCPASRFRFIQFIPFLERAGWEVVHRPNRPDRLWRSPLRTRLGRAVHYRAGRVVMRFNRIRDMVDSSRFDVAYIGRDFAGEGGLMGRFFLPMVQKGVYDFDDAIFVGPKEKAVRWMCANARWVTPGNEYLAKYASQFTDRITIIPTVIDTDAYIPRCYAAPHSATDRVRVGWSGSDQSIGATLVPHLEMLRRLQKEIDFELVIITNTRPRLPVSDLRWSFHPWRPEDEHLLESKFDIGIMPLIDDLFQKGKCALKLLQYMAAGLPTVASPVGVNKNVVQPGTGMLASSEAEWREALIWLIKNKEARAAMGSEGRKLCEEQYSIRRWLPVLLGILETVKNERAAQDSL